MMLRPDGSLSEVPCDYIRVTHKLSRRRLAFLVGSWMTMTLTLILLKSGDAYKRGNSQTKRKSKQR